MDDVRAIDFGSYNGCEGCFVRHGSLLGGGTDGANELDDLGLDEAAYKMSLEQYRDLREVSREGCIFCKSTNVADISNHNSSAVTPRRRL